MIHIQNPVYYRKFRHIHAYSRHIKTYLEPCVALAYSEPCQIQNPGIYRTHIKLTFSLGKQVLP